jgi:hypothetical protein
MTKKDYPSIFSALAGYKKKCSVNTCIAIEKTRIILHRRSASNAGEIVLFSALPGRAAPNKREYVGMHNKPIRVVLADPEDNIANDRLDQIGAIAEFWFGTNTLFNRRKCYRLIVKGVIPAAKSGMQLVASKKALRRRWAELTGADAAADLVKENPR